MNARRHWTDAPTPDLTGYTQVTGTIDDPFAEPVDGGGMAETVRWVRRKQRATRRREALAASARAALIALLLLAAWALAAWQVRGVRALPEPERLGESLAIIRAGQRAACVLCLVAAAGIVAYGRKRGA